MLRALIDFTLYNARRFYSSMGNLLDRKGLINGANCISVAKERKVYDKKIYRMPSEMKGLKFPFKITLLENVLQKTATTATTKSKQLNTEKKNL